MAFPMFCLLRLVAGFTYLQDSRVQVRGPASSAPHSKLVIEVMAMMDIHCIYALPMIFDDIVKNHSDDFSKRAGNTIEHCSQEVCLSSCYPLTVLTSLDLLALAIEIFLLREWTWHTGKYFKSHELFSLFESWMRTPKPAQEE